MRRMMKAESNEMPGVGGTTPGNARSPSQSNAGKRSHGQFPKATRAIIVTGPKGVFKLSGKIARVLRRLSTAGDKGVSVLDLGSWGFRLATIIYTLRHDHALEIVTIRTGGRRIGPATYVLRSAIHFSNIPKR